MDSTRGTRRRYYVVTAVCVGIAVALTAVLSHRSEPPAIPIAGAVLHPKVVTQIETASTVTGGVWSPDGTRMAAYTERSKELLVWDVTGKVVQTIHRAALYDGDSLAFTSDGTQLITTPSQYESGDIAFAVVDIATGQTVREVHGRPPARFGPLYVDRFVLSPDRKLLALSYDFAYQEPVTLYSTEEWSVVAQVPDIGGRFPEGTCEFAFSPDSKTLALGMAHNDIRIYDIAQKTIIKTFRSFPESDATCAESMAYSPSGKQLAIGAALSAAARVLPGGGWEQIFLTHPLEVRSPETGDLIAAPQGQIQAIHYFAWDPGERFLLFIPYDYKLRLWTVASDAPAHLIDLDPGQYDVGCPNFSPDGKRLLVCKGTSLSIVDLGEVIDHGQKNPQFQ